MNKNQLIELIYELSQAYIETNIDEDSCDIR